MESLAELFGGAQALLIAGIVFFLIMLAGLVIATIAMVRDAQQRGMRSVLWGVGIFWGLVLITALIAALYKVPPLGILSIWGLTSFTLASFGLILYLLIRKTLTCEWGHPIEFSDGRPLPCRLCARERQQVEAQRKYQEELVQAISARLTAPAAAQAATATPAGLSPRATQPITVAPPTFARLFVVDGPMRGREFPVNAKGNTRIGRDASNDIALIEDPSVSAEHAVIKVEDGQYMLWDLASTNGTFLYPAGSSWKDEKAKVRVREPRALMDKDVIEVGKTKLVFSSL